MKKLDTVEDYIIALFEGSSLGFGMSNNYQDPIYRLASYDTRVVGSIHNQISFQSLALTDRQAELCVKLIEKYSRQFAKNGIDNVDVLDSKTRKFKFPLRQIDREYKLYLKDDIIHAQFPYDIKIINKIRTAKDGIVGMADWDRGLKAWKFALTEPFVKFTVEFGQKHDFTIDKKLLEIYDKVVNTDYKKYRIELQKHNETFVIQNCPDSLNEYIETETKYSDFIRLVDLSSVCGYTVSKEIEEYINLGYNKTVSDCLLQKHIWAEPKETNVVDLFNYADLTNRFPITIYDNLGTWTKNGVFMRSNIYKELHQRYGPIWYDDKLPDDVENGDKSTAKIRVYTGASKSMFEDEKIPLLITMQNFNFGSLKLHMIDKCEKIVYNCIKL